MNDSVYEDARKFLERVYINPPIPTKELPFVTLTFAQSLDGKIALKGQQLLLSGKESMAMTHRLRLLHDGILVGIGTALIDDPQLNARYVSPTDHLCNNQPQPIVLDPRLEFPLSAKLLRNFNNGTGKQPWLICWTKNDQRKLALEKAGALVITIEAPDYNVNDYQTCQRPSISSVLRHIKAAGIDRLMVEGGSKIIQSFLQSGHIDQLIVTTAPTLVGPRGVSATGDIVPVSLSLPALHSNIIYQQFGQDMVLGATLQKKKRTKE
ncbi:bacterial bifunctional deaminase-reductase [Phycomyces blakesleeanus]